MHRGGYEHYFACVVHSSFLYCISVLVNCVPLVAMNGTETVQVTPSSRTLASSAETECTNCHQQEHAGNKTLLKQNLPFLNWGCQLAG